MLELLKINNGLIKVENTEGVSFLNDVRAFTSNSFFENVNGVLTTTGLPYQIIDDENISISLESHIVNIIISDTTIDNIKFNTINEFIEYVFN